MSRQSRVLRLNNKTVSIEDYAFYLGAQRIPAEEGLNEIDHHFRQEEARIEAASVQKQKPLEAILECNATKRPKVDASWDIVNDLFGHHPPPVALFYAIGALGLVALIIDAILTGPGLDALNISDPALQYVAAFALAALAASTFHLALESFESKRMDVRNRWGSRILGLFSILGLTCWGILRGRQIAFGADLSHNPLGEFLHGHIILSSAVFCFITVGSPLAAAFATGRAATQIHDADRWNRARKERDNLLRSTADAKKTLESERETTAHKLSELGALKREWQSCFLLYYARGHVRGSRQEPFWTVIVRSSFVGLAVLLPALLLAHYVGWLAFTLPIVAALFAFIHYRRLRFTPTYRQFRRIEFTRFAIPSDASWSIEPREPHTLEASVEDCHDR